ncbi:ethanolamine utilization protein [Brachyspira hyodysenteriae]|uniref:ethanolamine utilization protein n=1 Tax=Brachyspira hyodysenteriae TaxID=159 RepID=UPI00063DA82C|nr:ethanolamine utilization protein [Brachyspira hyodysenteriae]KLI24256.1 ethanolamine utilization protein [Brachyspira hyodysenteriae]TVL58854.1 ethanolamine utilization protein [Brachyspira hyodysenteriae]
MRVITEEMIINDILDKDVSEYFIEEGDFLTLSARKYLDSKNIEIKIKTNNCNVGSFTSNPKSYGIKEIENIEYYIDYETNKRLDTKHENYTHLYDNVLVEKNHPRIILRGKLDSLLALIVDIEYEFKERQEYKLLEYLKKYHKLIHAILYSEVTNKSLELDTIFGLTDEEIRKISHHPKEYFGCDHIFINYNMPYTVIKLNLIRTAVRETELIAYNALKNEREDIIKVLNRMSSAVYILMLIAYTGKDILE